MHFDIDRYLSWEGGINASLRSSSRTAAASIGAGLPFPFPMDPARRTYGNDRPVVFSHVALDLQVHLERQMLVGSASLDIAPTRPLDELVLDARLHEVSAVSWNGSPCEFTHEGGRITLSFPSPATSPGTIKVDYIVKESTRGAYFILPDEHYPDRRPQLWTQGQDVDSCFWFPCIDMPYERVTSEIRATVPSWAEVLSNGSRISDSTDGEWRTVHYRQDTPHTFYLMSLVVGEYTVISEDCDGIPVEFFIPPGREDDGRRSFGRTSDMIRFFSRKLGYPYPWAKYSQSAVAEFIFGGMENTSCTTQTDMTLHDEKAHVDFSSDPLVAHELAHMWFGDLVTCREWSEGWLNEGFATYFGALWTEEDLGYDDFELERIDIRDAYLAESKKRYNRPIVDRRFQQPIELFDRHLYQKGGCVVHMLRKKLGESNFWRALNYYLKRHEYQGVETADLRRSIFEATGVDLSSFFDQFIYREAHPRIKVWHSHDPVQGKLTLKYVQQTDEAYDIDTTVRIWSAKGAYNDHPVTLDSKKGEVVIDGVAVLELFRMDPGNDLLVEWDQPRSVQMMEFQAAHDPEPSGRILALRALRELKDPLSETVVAGLLRNDGFWGVRKEAAMTLATIGTMGAMHTLLSVVETDPHPKSRRAIAAALGSFREPDAVSKLEELCRKGDESYFVEAALADSLARAGAGMEHLEYLVKRESWADVARAGALTGYAHRRDLDVTVIEKAIMDALAPGNDPRLRMEAIVALKTLHHGMQSVVEAVGPFIFDHNFRVKGAAIASLGDEGHMAAIPVLEEGIRKETNFRLRRAMVEAVARIEGDWSAAERYVEELKD